MAKVVCDCAVSLDGFTAGHNQSLEHPFGDIDKDTLTAWMFRTPEERLAEDGMRAGIGAYIMGRNMFTPDRGEWNLDWRGWWGEEPPYHAPVFVLTHYARESLPMEGGTTFHFVTDGIESALAQARAAAGDRDVAIAGGTTTVNEYLAAGLLDELRIHRVPMVAGKGVRLFEGVGPFNLEAVSTRQAERVTHTIYRIPHDRS
ncbi:MAG TPA: dihydrofolate reductase family protein [Thermomicrobiales bacterium]|nr:dihydrofolate reductase family protein [Thermomicrobiales bacterium]